MPLNNPPLGYTGETPVKQNSTVKESLVRAATAAEVLAGTVTSAYVSPATLTGFITPVAGSGSSTSITANNAIGSQTITGLTTASGSSATITITNSLVAATSPILVSISTLGTNDAELTIQRIKPAAGSFVVTAKNNGAAAVNGNVIITWWVL